MAHRFHPAILRDYDIRGTVGRTLFAADAYALGRSFGTVVKRTGGQRVAVGRDGRLSSPMLETALVEGLAGSGVDVVRIGLGPSPMLYFAEAVMGVDAGIQVTGSHNPPDDNGFKMVLGHRAYWGEDIPALATLAAAGEWEDGSGRIDEIGMLDRYVARLAEDASERPFRIGWDCGSGAAGPAVEALTARLPGEHHLLYTRPDGHFPHHHPDPTEEKNLADLKRLVVERSLDFGFAFDGDGDRIGAVDGAGRTIAGDMILALLAEPLLADRPGATIIADVKSSQTVFDRIAALGGRPLMTRTGHSAIKSEMLRHAAPLAGEMSGHIFFGEAAGWYGFDDALYAAVRLIGAVARSGRSLAAVRDGMPSMSATPDLRIPVPDEQKHAAVAKVAATLAVAGADMDTIDGVRVRDAEGWWLLRVSNTQAAITVRAEATDEAALDRLLATVRGHLARVGVTSGL
ncbi:phosphomannomutase [Sphingomonas metalli]|uniref:Phosphomannomutase n=1 Tax=Sphingomonas metalli TaxID=1779358 RepID=A0A916T277_9SPHN|nr:phosphomannomutase/phosphoglucomutase [Sphingomonas metalli]GGB25249.1 phosphomannomutase [Sphingomonas metalli]